MEKKTTEEIMAKLNISQLNKMQEMAIKKADWDQDLVLLSPTGSGKTLAYLLPLLKKIDPKKPGVQALIVVPTRELAVQVENVLRDMGTGYKVNSFFGGRPKSIDRENLRSQPTIAIGTPGRLSDHFESERIYAKTVANIVLDEFDKCLEAGFEDEMKSIFQWCNLCRTRMLTSATQHQKVPEFVGLRNPAEIEYFPEFESKLMLKTIYSPYKDKLDTLYQAICHMGNQPGVVFCNFKDSIQRVSDFLKLKGITHSTFHGDLDQNNREKSLIKFRNGSSQVLLASDLAARGLDVDDLGFVMHYHIPMKEHEFTHRNGRTARMNKDGIAYVLRWVDDQDLPAYIEDYPEEVLSDAPHPDQAKWETLCMSVGRKDKVSKGDIAGFLSKQGNLSRDDLGKIEIQPHMSYAAVNPAKLQALLKIHSKIKNNKVRITHL
tara:strand:+ start:486 stop:1787 length:1302 start_codon:yes stop_codon:yes gene_type:complete